MWPTADHESYSRHVQKVEDNASNWLETTATNTVGKSYAVIFQLQLLSNGMVRLLPQSLGTTHEAII